MFLSSSFLFVVAVSLERERYDRKMPQETNYLSSVFTSPCKNLRGLKSVVSNNEASYTEEIINDYELAHRKAEEAGAISDYYYFACLFLYNFFFFLCNLLYFRGFGDHMILFSFWKRKGKKKTNRNHDVPSTKCG